MIAEPDVALTDYALAIEAALLAYWTGRQPGLRGRLRRGFMLFFTSVGVAAAAGGTVHGFLPQEASAPHAILWRAALIAIGGAALAAWGIGASIQFPTTVARWIIAAAALEFGIYALFVAFVSQEFVVAIINYVPASVFLLTSFLILYARRRSRHLLIGATGLTLTFAASWVQQRGISLYALYLTHNALYHLIQALALVMIFWTGRCLLAKE